MKSCQLISRMTPFYYILIFIAVTITSSLQLFPNKPILPSPSIQPLVLSKQNYKRGIIDYIGNTSNNIITLEESSEISKILSFQELNSKQLFKTKFQLWRQLPWKKFKNNTILKLKIGGSLPLESSSASSFSFGGIKDFEPVSSLEELLTLFNYASYDPRIVSVFVELGPLSCGYAKLIELRRIIKLFQQSGKKVIGFSETVSEKELYLSLGFDEFFVPPEGGVDIRGFVASATFLRGVFDKIGIEPQVQRIGKYKSFGDTFNRTFISEAQREVISSLLCEASNHWVKRIANDTNNEEESIRDLWSEEGVKSPSDFKNKNFITGVRYYDQVEAILKSEYSTVVPANPIVLFFQQIANFFNSNNSSISKNMTGVVVESDLVDYDIDNDFSLFPRRVLGYNNSNNNDNKNEKSKTAIKLPNVLAGGMYLRRMRKGSRLLEGLPLREVRSGPRFAIINAVGGINSGESGNSPLSGKSVGSDSLVRLLREAERDSNIKGVILRVDSPGGSALASDIMWRAIRTLSRKKPVVASMVDVAASGGYYLSMACDQIVAEELTVTGSIGVVTSKFNVNELNQKLGFNSETISIGRYAELFSTSRGFTEDESDVFERFAQKAYRSFITKAAKSRNMTYEAMNEVGQGRVWTGRQASDRGLVDHLGGLFKALDIVHNLTSDNSSYNNNSKSNKFVYNIQTLKEPSKGFSLPFGGASISSLVNMNSLSSSGKKMENILTLCDDDCLHQTGLVSRESMGISDVLTSVGMTTTSLQFMLNNYNIDISKVLSLL